MYKKKSLDKLVAAGIITAEQQQQILDYEDTSNGGFIVRALTLLAVFTIGIGVISLVASNWEYISDGFKLFVMFGVLSATAGLASYYKYRGMGEKTDKMLVGLFLFVGAAIGLVIQIYHLSGGKIHPPLAFWCVSTLPLLFVAEKNYVAKFWVPLFLVWLGCYVGDNGDWEERFLAIYAIMAAVGAALCYYKPKFLAGKVLQRYSIFAFYLFFAFYILFAMWGSHGGKLIISALILVLSTAGYYYFKACRMVKLNVKYAGLWVFALYIYLGDEIGLFSTGIGLIISGVLLILLMKGVSWGVRQVKGGSKDA